MDRSLPPTRGRSRDELPFCWFAGDAEGEALSVTPGEPEGETVDVDEEAGEVVGTMRRGLNSRAFDLTPGDGESRGTMTPDGVDFCPGAGVASGVGDGVDCARGSGVTASGEVEDGVVVGVGEAADEQNIVRATIARRGKILFTLFMLV